jgi:RNA polymerase sigma-70 factor, ECF subfamily
MQSTAALVRSAIAGERSAFAELVRLYERSAIVTAQAVLGDYHAAQDAAQDGFVMAYQKLGQLRDIEAFGPWLLAIVRRRATEIGAKPRVVAPPDGEFHKPAKPGWITQFEEVSQHIDRLPEHERLVVMLRYLDGHSVAAIAEMTGKPLGTVTKQLSRAIERLKSWLSEVQS